MSQWNQPFMLAIETTGLTKTFRSWRRPEFCAVDSVSLAVEPGATFGLLGPNGAGKTTFVKMLLSAVLPTRGAAKLFGRDSREPEARRPVGYLPENHRFPTYLTGRGMLDFYGALSGVDAAGRKQRTAELLELVGLQAWGGVRLRKYSKGMLQRIGLAQALLHRPRLLILDEPSDGVDPLGRKQIREILHGLEQQGVAIFINSHLLAEVELFCRDVAILHKGKIALEGNVKKLTAGGGYRLTTAPLPEAVAAQLRSKAAAFQSVDERMEFQFAGREEANRAIDLVRGQNFEIQSLAPTTSTLEEVFLKTVQA